MAIRFYTSDPQTLLDAIYKAIDDGHVETWTYDDEGDFSHNRPQWVGKAWLEPTVEADSLLLTTIPPKGGSVTVRAYAIYHGRFAEMVLSHFDKLFSHSWISALGSDGDSLQ